MATVRMPDGTLVKNVPEGATKEEITEVYIKAQGFENLPELRAVEPGIIEKTGDFFKDVGTAMTVNQTGLLRPAFDALVRQKNPLIPTYDNRGSFQGFKKSTKEEAQAQRDKDNQILREALDAPEKGGAADITGRIVGELIDPINAVATAASLTGQGMVRLLRLAATGASVETANSVAQQVSEKGVDNVDGEEVAIRAIAGGVGAPVLDLSIRLGAKVIAASKGSEGAMDKFLTKLEDNVFDSMQQGLNKKEAIKRSLISQKAIGPDMIETAVNKTGRKIVFTLENPRLAGRQEGKRSFEASRINKLALAPARKLVSGTGAGLERLLTPISSRIRDISAPVFNSLRKLEMFSHVNAAKKLESSNNFLRAIKKVKGQDRKDLTLAVFNRNADEVATIAERLDKPDILKGYTEIRKMLDDTFDELVGAGFSIGTKVDDVGVIPTLTNFFPRTVKDLKGLRDRLGVENSSQIDRAIQQATANKGQGLSRAEEADVINKVLAGFGPRKAGVNNPGFIKERKIEEVTEDLLPFYDDLEKSLINYIDNAVHSIEKHKFFGKSINKNPNTNKNIQNSIGRVIANEQEKGRLTFEEASELSELLTARFVGGETPLGGIFGGLRNIFYSSTLGQPTSAATQLGDLGLSAFMNGVVNTVKGALGKRMVTVEEFNLARKIQEEFGTSGATAKALNTILKWTGFKFIDKIGKTANINGAILQARQQVKVQNSRGMREFEREWKDVFGSEYNKLIRDLNSDKITDNVKLLAWHRLSDVQPISLSEMPQVYLNSPGGRMFYMLKTFTIKQFDLMRRRAFRDIAQGNVARGSTQLARFGMTFGAANMGASEIKNWMRGRDVPFDDTVVDSLWRNFGTSQYVVDIAKSDRPTELLGNLMSPPVGLLDAPLDLVIGGADDFGKSMNSLGRSIPFVGEMYYQWFGGGIEAFEKKQREKSRAGRSSRRTRDR